MNFSLSLHLLGVEVAKCSHTVSNSCGNYEMRLILAIKMNIKHECLQCRRYIDSTELQQHLSHRKLTGEKSSRALVHRVNSWGFCTYMDGGRSDRRAANSGI